MRAVARGGDVGGDRVAESLLVIFGGDLVVKRPSCTDSIEDKSVQELVIFVWYRACPKVQSWNNRSSEPRHYVNRGSKPNAHTYSVLVLSRGS